VGSYRVAHEVCGADFKAYAIMTEDRRDCVDDFKREAAFVRGGAVVVVDSVVEVAGAVVSEIPKMEE
jgi:hypothetical protein